MYPSTKPSTNIQWNAIQNGATGNNLINQLYAGKTVTQSPNVVAASTAVKPTTAPQTTFSTPFSGGASSLASSVGSTLSKNTPSSPLNSSLAGIFNTQPPATAQTPMLPGLGGGPAPTAPTNQAVTSHSVTDASGNTTKQTYAPVIPATPDKTASTTAPVTTADHTTALPTGPQGTPQTQFAGLVGGAADAARGNAPIGESAAKIAADYGKQIADVGQQGAMGEAGQLTTGTTPVAEGNAAVTQQTTAARQQALAAGESAALQGTGQQLTAQNQQQTGLLGAGALAQPSLGGYNQQAFDPLTGKFSGGSGNLDPQSQGSQLAQQVLSGQMDFDTALSQMDSYGPAGSSALRNAILAQNPNFNFNLSQASKQTQATGQQIAAAIPPANQALDALQEAFSNLPGIQSTSIPLLNQLTQAGAMSTGIGREQASAFQGALAEARARIDGALQGIIGVDAAAAQATALLPDNMIPSEIPQKITAAKQYLQNQLNSYTQSGQQQSAGSSGTSGSTWSW